MSRDPFTFTTERADRFHVSYTTGDLQRQLYAEAFGSEYPAEVEPTSSCTWSVLASMVRGLRLGPDEHLVDLGCGRGGPGLWLARAFSARLTGVDLSPKACAMATARAAHFGLGGRASFQVGTFEDTGLADGAADGVISMDALPFSPDRRAALRELHRVLRPGGRAVITCGELAPDHPKYRSWRGRLTDAGFTVEGEEERSEEAGLWQRLYALWGRHEAELRAQIGDEATEDLLAEARIAGPQLPLRRSLVLTAVR
ncbi:class I SAM-dependent methyltransferase [Nonomuraea sp. NPDC050556]|uniref:class I SAM-dependent methyltransferase n=1 Tax=Nonomuraea sp. NPDC050556 TaxID=3364369 RepID=UPI0037B36D62